MAKDPAFLFYSADFFMGTIGMTDAQVGQYIRLMCLQHQQGHLPESIIKSVAGNKPDAVLLSKFIQDEDGNYYNKRLEEETEKRNNYTQSRRKNARSKKSDDDTRADAQEEQSDSKKDGDGRSICEAYAKHMPKHMENENENENIYISPSLGNQDSNESMTVKKQPAQKRFKPPDLEQVMQYCRERNNRVDPEKFINHYTSNGWKVGRNPMKDWKAAVRNWEKNDGQQRDQLGGPAGSDRGVHTYPSEAI